MPVIYDTSLRHLPYGLELTSRDGVSCRLEVVPRPFFPEFIYGFASVPPPPPFKESEVPSVFSKPVEFVDIPIVGAGK